MASDTDQEDFSFGEMFEEPAGYLPPPPPSKLVEYTRPSPLDPRTIKINLLGTHPLWGHHLWNASKVFASYIDANPQTVRNKSVLELGAAGALPSMIACAQQARRIVVTDYPDADLLQNIQTTVDLNFPRSPIISVAGHLWGHNIENILELNGNHKYNVLVLCDLVFNHSEHASLMRSVLGLLEKDGRAFVVFTHHRPWLVEQDLKFLERAQSEGLVCERILEEYTGAMFDDDPGDERVRGTVHGFVLSYPVIVDDQ